MLKRMTAVAFVLVSSSMCMGLANGALIDVRFGTPGIGSYSGAAVIGTAGDTWNLITSNSSGNVLVNSTGGSTSVTLDLTSLGLGNLAGNSGPFDSTPYKNLFDGITAASGGNPITVTLNGVAPGAYDLYLLAAPNHAAVQNRTLIASATTSVGTVGPLTIGPNSGASTLVQGTNWAVLNPIVGVNGVLTISGLVGVDEGDLNGFQLINAVPEPSGLALVSIAALGFVAKLRRRRS